MKAVGGLLIVLALLCGNTLAELQFQRRPAILKHLSGHMDVVASEPVVDYVNVVELHDDVASAVKAGSSSSVKQSVAETENTPPNPATSFESFDLSGKLAGDYDPFSQVRHLVDGVFEQHEQQLKTEQGQQLQHLPSPTQSTFLEVQSFVTRKHHHHHRRSVASSASDPNSLQPVGEISSSFSQDGLPSSYVMHPVLSSTSVATSLPIRFQSSTIPSASLGAQAIPEGYVVVTDDDILGGASFLQLSSKVTKVQSFCEICILVMQMKERGEPHLCAGLNANYYITCVEVLESILRADKALVYWLKEGCMHLDTDGPEIVRPCPAINICSWVPNLFTPPPTIVRDEVEALCPKDLRFLPTIPEEYRALLGARRF